MSAAMLEAALSHARLGRPVFPAGFDKRPRVEHGLLDATTDLAAIRLQWDRWPAANVALRTGEPSGLVVLDVDGQEGADSLHDLEAEHGALLATRSVVTPRGGAHNYFRWPGVAVKTTAGALGLGLDVRGDGAYVLVPPSRTADGWYEWDATVPPAEMPAWLLELTRAESSGREVATPPDVWTAMLDVIPKGERNASLARLAGYFLRHYVDVDLAAGLVHLVNATRCTTPLPRVEVDRIVDSISRAELRRREARS